MDTIRSFVRTVWSQDITLTPKLNKNSRREDPDTKELINKSWITPDDRAGSHELRRITTPEDVNGVITDFYELYWSDVTQGTTVERLKAWVMGLLLRKWSDVPTDVRKLYVLLWIASLAFALPALIAAAIPLLGLKTVFHLPATAWTGIAAVMAFILSRLLPFLGDVAIYVQAFPGTVGKRKEARERGLTLMSGLMEDRSYDRIVMVAHSLGTILAYDLLQILWAKYAPNPKQPRDHPALLRSLRAVGAMALPIGTAERAAVRFDKARLAAFRRLQWEAYEQLRIDPVGEPLPWKISDFVTFGSPLTHAEFLMTHNKPALDRAVEERQLSTCPPVSEFKTPTILYPSSNPKHPHHAAVFAATRWTNVYDEGNGWISGDPVSGSLEENFGPGIENIRVKLRGKLGRFVTHTKYWDADARGEEIVDGKPTGRSHLDVMRYAVDLRRRENPPAADDSEAALFA